MIFIMNCVLDIVLTGNERLLHQKLQPLICGSKGSNNLLNSNCLDHSLLSTILYQTYQILRSQGGQDAEKEDSINALAASPLRRDVARKTWKSNGFSPDFVNAQLRPKRNMKITHFNILEDVLLLHDDMLHEAKRAEFETRQFQLLQIMMNSFYSKAVY